MRLTELRNPITTTGRVKKLYDSVKKSATKNLTSIKNRTVRLPYKIRVNSPGVKTIVFKASKGEHDPEGYYRPWGNAMTIIVDSDEDDKGKPIASGEQLLEQFIDKHDTFVHELVHAIQQAEQTLITEFGQAFWWLFGQMLSLMGLNIIINFFVRLPLVRKYFNELYGDYDPASWRSRGVEQEAVAIEGMFNLLLHFKNLKQGRSKDIKKLYELGYDDDPETFSYNVQDVAGHNMGEPFRRYTDLVHRQIKKFISSRA